MVRLEVLHEIDEELTKSDVAALKFLCVDVLSKKRLESVKDAKDLFKRLKEQNLLDDSTLLAELLYIIGRYDLLRYLKTNSQEVSRSLQNQTDSSSGVSSYRVMLYKLSEDITNENLKSVKFLLTGLPQAKLQSATFLDVLTEMEKTEMLGEDKMDVLEAILDKCDKELANRVRTFQNSQISRQPEGNVVPSAPPQEKSLDDTNVPSPMEVSQESDARECTPTTDKPEEDCYHLKRRPRGYCLIINNMYFTNLPPRKGTEKDEEELKRIFSKLHFQVEVKANQSSSDMLQVIKEFSEKDHSQMDAFVCCVLSHGMKGTVYGTDEQQVEIRDFTLSFAHCKSLLDKPKLFFIQACQGTNFQRSAYIKADGDAESSEENYEQDAQSITFYSIPIEADFLIGMATVESYKSFRHTQKGSIFIQELCKQIENGLQHKEDILSILTRVNREVSKKILNGHKQMPEPRYTLTKKLVFTLD
ncbi:caspase-8 isoform X2 [Hoplias malabaricus]|uniref:caspase-8 isoform X2 n=1 Tax=Hoplias malabaricus TaxID=27720 RepID=UPI003462DF6F